MHKKLAFAAVVAALAVLEGDAVALDPGACCVFSTSKLDAMMNPVRGGDEKFFTASGGPPTVLFVLDTGGQMQAWPTPWPRTDDGGYGCQTNNVGLSNNPATVTDGGTGTDWSDFTRATGAYVAGYDAGNGDPSSTGYGQLWTGLGTIDSDWFDDNEVWEAADAGLGDPGGPAPVGVKFAGLDGGAGLDAKIEGGCATVAAAQQATCVQCLKTDGYFVSSTERRLVTGHFLNYYGPRDASMVKVMSDILHDIANVRFGMVVLKASGGGASCAKTGPNEAMCVTEDFKPPCSQWPSADASGQKNSILGNIKNLVWGGGTPLGDLLYAGAHFYGGRSVTDQFQVMFGAGYPTDNKLDEKSGQNRSICASCGLNTAILVTGSYPIGDGAAGDWANVIGTLPTQITSQGTSTPGYYGPTSYVADVARYFYEKADLVNNTASVIAGDTMVGRQKMTTYTVAFTSDREVNALLQRTARVGGGARFQATNASKLKEAIWLALNDIMTRNTAFSSAAVPSLQTGSQQLTAVVPRMRPQAGQSWQGELWRFRLANEFVLDVDINGDGDKSDTFSIEEFAAPNVMKGYFTPPVSAATATLISQHIVVEDPNGDFVVATASSGTIAINTPLALATPAWEANAKLSTAGYAARQVFTVVDDKTLDPANPTNAGTVGGDGAFTHHDTRIQFNAAAAGQLLDYLGIAGTSFCPNLSAGTLGDFYSKLELDGIEAANALGVAAPVNQDESDVLCAKALINWTLGQDLGDTNGDGLRTDTREQVLGDIFHSSPVVVEPPMMEPFLCELGLSNQCIQTLYQQYLPTPATPLTNYGSEPARCAGPTVARTAYEKYAMDARLRPQLVLVGANDGMLHAFHGGTATEDCSVTPPTLDFDPGTGAEVWAFIPPDVLPRLREVPLGHTYLLDGDIMVRDIWAESSTNANQKDADEYHTLAIASEGRGGNHYFALEIAFDSSNVPQPPNFRWMYPQPCSLESITFGKTFYSLAPKPPPIGPVLVKADTSVVFPNRGSGIVRSTVNPSSAASDPSNEVWVAMLSGGWSPMLERGRGVYMVDAWYGAVNGRRDNLWWKWDYRDSASGEQQGPRQHMVNSIAAPVAMVDYGSNARVGLDGFFDTAVVGDTFGQLWVLRFGLRGTLDTSSKLIDNWAGGRGFMVDRRSVFSDGDSDVEDSDNRNRWPFFYLPSIAIQPGTNAMRAYIGSGDRVHLLDRQAGACRFDNPLACSKYDCDEVRAYYRVQKMDYDINSLHTHWEDEHVYKHSSENVSTGLGRTACGTVDVDHNTFEVQDCPGVDPKSVNEVSTSCGRITPDGGYNCYAVSVSGTRQLNDLATTPSNGLLDALGRNRYFGVWVYGGTRGIFDESETSGSGNRTARDFDQALVSDRTSGNATSGDLVDVTGAFCDQLGACKNFGGATIAGNPDNGVGWMFEFRDDYTASGSFTRASLEHKTASGSTVLGGCVLYSSLYPVQGTSCNQVAQARSRLHQGDYISGLPNCAESFKQADGGWTRYQDRDVLAPPPELSANVQISAAGKIKYSSLVLEPSKSQATEIAVTVGSDILQSVYEVPMSAPLHNCRHVDGGCTAFTP